MRVTIRMVNNAADFETFFRFPWQLYGTDHPFWVPNLPSLRRDTLDKDKHAAWNYLDGDYFIAWRGANPVGTIAAFVNHRHNEFYDDNIGFFGFFDCIDDQDVADALLATAETYLEGKGVRAIRGPANFSSNEEWGVLVDSYDQLPMFMMPYNYAYYAKLIEGAGYHKVMGLESWQFRNAEVGKVLFEADGFTDTRIVRTVKRNMQRRDITLRTIDMTRRFEEFSTLRAIYDDAWEKNWGFVPMTDQELDDLVENLSFLILPEYTYFGMLKGETVGFMLLIPNLNEALAHVRPHPDGAEPWWYLKTLWHWKMRPKVKSLRMIIMGVKQAYRGLGVESAMFLRLAYQMLKDQAHFDMVEASWVLETNDAMRRLGTHFGAEIKRRHRLYEKDLSAPS